MSVQHGNITNLQELKLLAKSLLHLEPELTEFSPSWNVCIPGKEDQWSLLVHGCLRSAKAVNNAEISNEIQIHEARFRRQAYIYWM